MVAISGRCRPLDTAPAEIWFQITSFYSFLLSLCCVHSDLQLLKLLNSSKVSSDLSSALGSVCWVFSRCSRRFLKKLGNLRSSAATVGAPSQKQMFAMGMVDFSITDSFQISIHSLAMRRLSDQRLDNEFDLKGSGILEQTVKPFYYICNDTKDPENQFLGKSKFVCRPTPCAKKRRY